MKLDKKGREHLIQEEGLKLKAYKDTVGIWTIGVGNTYYEDGSKVKQGDVITKERADSLLSIVSKQFEDNINKVVTVPLNQNQFNALVSFSYNIGIGAFNKSTLLKLLNQGEYIQAAEQFMKWLKPPELKGRRNRERTLFLTMI